MESSIEGDVGISCYITSTPSLSAILKQRQAAVQDAPVLLAFCGTSRSILSKFYDFLAIFASSRFDNGLAPPD